jgi:hypothetical protein
MRELRPRSASRSRSYFLDLLLGLLDFLLGLLDFLLGLDWLTVFFDVFEVFGGLLAARTTGNSRGKPAIAGTVATIEKPVMSDVSLRNFRRLRLRIITSRIALPSGT